MAKTKDLKREVKEAKREAMSRLRRYGIDDRFTVKVRSNPSFNEHTLACYRGMSQFRSGPIFWINPQFLQIVERESLSSQAQGILVDTLLHEYGHVMYEYIRWNESAGLKGKVEALNTGPDFEEDFAESMAQALSGRCPDPVYEQIARDFGADLAKKLG